MTLRMLIGRPATHPRCADCGKQVIDTTGACTNCGRADPLQRDSVTNRRGTTAVVHLTWLIPSIVFAGAVAFLLRHSLLAVSR